MKIQDKIKEFKSAADNLVSQHLVKNIRKNIKKRNWDSSAQKLENTLKSRGIVLPQKLYYEYKFPGGLKNFEFEQQDTLTGFCNIYRRYLINLSHNRPNPRHSVRVAMLHQQKSLKGFLFYDDMPKTDLSDFFGFCICLAVSDVKKLESAFMSAQEQLYELADLIKEMNPELQGIKNHRSIDFIAGAEYGFSPQEIQFFLNLQERRAARKFDTQYETDGKDEELKHTKESMRKIEKFIGSSTGYFLAPETSDKIAKAIDEHMMLIQKQHYME